MSFLLHLPSYDRDIVSFNGSLMYIMASPSDITRSLELHSFIFATLILPSDCIGAGLNFRPWFQGPGPSSLVSTVNCLDRSQHRRFSAGVSMQGSLLDSCGQIFIFKAQASLLLASVLGGSLVYIDQVTMEFSTISSPSFPLRV